ncbi:MAG: VOC family protein [Gemmatimonadaceae bacterium]
MSDTTPGKILGIGGIFFKAQNHETLRAWYQEKLGIVNGPGGAMFPWRDAENPETERLTVWSIFPAESDYYRGPFMINYIVDDLDAYLAKLTAAGVAIDPKRDDHDYGRFAWIYDSEGTKIELWQPT